jgi:peptidylprolyl isomerase
VPSINLDYVSPLESPDLRATLGIDSVKFSLDYIDTKVGTGPVAAPHMWYTVNYTGYLLDGTKFDSNADHPGGAPFSFPYGQHHVIAGWDTGLDGMRVGGKRRLFVPWELAYGPNGKPPTIPAKAELIFDIELLSQSEKDPTPQPAAAKPAAPTPTPQKTPAASASPAPPAGPAAAPAVPPAASAPAATPAPATPPK